jgi:hypothetical protein
VIYKVLQRYTLPLAIPLYVVAARGMQVWFEERARRKSLMLVGAILITWLSLCVGFLTGFGEFEEGMQTRDALVSAGEILRNAESGSGPIRILASDSRIPFECGRHWEWLPLPRAHNEESLLLWARSQNADYLAITESDVDSRLRPWLEVLGMGPEWELIGETDSPKILLYRLRR